MSIEIRTENHGETLFQCESGSVYSKQSTKYFIYLFGMCVWSGFDKAEIDDYANELRKQYQ